MGNSSLATDWKLNQCISSTPGRDGYKIDKIIIHHMAMTDWSSLPMMWNSTETSAHYGINHAGEIRQYFTEDRGTWNCGDWAGNMTSVAIEHENTSGEPSWNIDQRTVDASAKLCADIAKRNNLGKLVVGKNLFPHKHFSSTACPGQLEGKLQEIAEKANKYMDGGVPDTGGGGEQNPIPDPDLPTEDDELKKLFEQIMNDATLKKTTTEYCLSILGYLPMSQIYDRPPMKRMS